MWSLQLRPILLIQRCRLYYLRQVCSACWRKCGLTGTRVEREPGAAAAAAAAAVVVTCAGGKWCVPHRSPLSVTSQRKKKRLFRQKRSQNKPADRKPRPQSSVQTFVLAPWCSQGCSGSWHEELWTKGKAHTRSRYDTAVSPQVRFLLLLLSRSELHFSNTFISCLCCPNILSLKVLTMFSRHRVRSHEFVLTFTFQEKSSSYGLTSETQIRAVSLSAVFPVIPENPLYVLMRKNECVSFSWMRLADANVLFLTFKLVVRDFI